MVSVREEVVQDRRRKETNGQGFEYMYVTCLGDPGKRNEVCISLGKKLET